MKLKDIFIQNLKEYRKTEGISQMKLAEYCNTSLGYIGEIEIGRKFPSTEMIDRIASVLRIEPYLFFKNPTGKNDKSEHKEKYPRLPYPVKKQLQKQIKANIKARINQSISDIINDNDEIFDRY